MNQILLSDLRLEVEAILRAKQYKCKFDKKMSVFSGMPTGTAVDSLGFCCRYNFFT